MTEPMLDSSTRVALRIAGGPGPAYLAAAAQAVAGVVGAEIVLILEVAPRPDPRPVRRRLHDQINAAYEWLERRTLRGGPAALATRTLNPSRNSTRMVSEVPGSEGHVTALLEAHVDVLIDLIVEERRAPLPIPPAGRWSLSYSGGIGGERRSGLSRPRASAGLAESLLSIELRDSHSLESELGVSGLRRIGYSRDRDAIYWRSSQLAARRLASLVAGEAIGSPSSDASRPKSGPPQPRSPRWDRPPFGRLATTLAGKVLERLLFRSGWVVFVRSRTVDQDPPRDLAGFVPVEAPPGRFYADPFVVSTQEGQRLYVEDCPDGAHHGRISTLRSGPGGRWAFERIALDDLEHRAYPHVIPTPVGLLMTPDGGRTGGVDLFVDRGPRVPIEHLGRCLEGVSASDPTLLWHEGRYWLFVTVTGYGMNPWDELHLFSAADLAGVWHPHPRNPVVADARRARPAGRIFRVGDRLIRPGQDCSESYGRRIALSVIKTLTAEAYEEYPISSIEPVGIPGTVRTHTYSFDDSVDALDGYRRILRFPFRRGSSR